MIGLFKLIYVILNIVLFLSYAVAGKKGCTGEYEVYQQCVNPCNEQRCSSQPVFCPAISEDDCTSGCICSEGYFRDDDGNCVSECPNDVTCPPGEQSTSCLEGLCIEQTCAQKGQPIACPIIADGSCTSGCICSDGFLRNDNGDCIPSSECPGICPPGEEFTNCTELGCQQLNCADLEQTQDCPIITDDDDSCTSGCICAVGTLRNDDGICIPKSQCPQSCNTNEEFSNCTQIVCRAQSCAQRDDPGSCTLVVEDDCNQGCLCIEGTLRNDQGVCVPEDQCEDLCPTGEEFTVCVEIICRAQECSQVGKQLSCPQIELYDCSSGCVCPEGFVRDDSGTCISEDQCSGDMACGDNEVTDTCPGPESCDFCPTSENDAKCAVTGPSSIVCGPAECRCGYNFKRSNDNGTCIDIRDCPPFDCSSRPNEEYDPCPSFCSDDCSQATPSGECNIIGRIGIVVECQPTCRCIQGYWRNNGICVPFAECDQTCPENEQYSSCPLTICRSQNCNDTEPPPCPFLPKGYQCQGGCVCVEGTLRDDNGNCVPSDQCPGSTSCGVNEILNTCANVCDSDSCSTSIDYPTDCISDNSCLSRCECAPNYKRDGNGGCIPQDQCPESTCGINEILNDCANDCQNDACPASSQDYQVIDCVYLDICLSRCQCAPGYKRDVNGICIPQDQCPGQECGLNEVSVPCAIGCNNDACPGSLYPIIIDCFEPDVCVPGCQCAPNYKRDVSGICIPEDQCPGPCSEYETLNLCPSVCINDSCPTNLNDDATDGACIQICAPPRCECISNYKRDFNGNCIPIQNCPSICGVNEVSVPCAGSCNNDACPGSLDDSTEDTCISTDICIPGCQCAPGYKRNANGVCIVEDQCPGSTCSEYEEYVQCINSCENDACPDSSNSSTDVACSQPTICISGCQCAPGYKRNGYGDCIPEDQCPGSACGEYEVYFQCVNSCDSDACLDISDDSTNNYCVPSDICVSGCQCASGYKRNANGDCIPEDQCPGSACGEYEVYLQCVNSCDSDACPGISGDSTDNYCVPSDICISGCQCASGYKRNANGDCITEDQCEGSSCGLNEVFVECANGCDNDACPGSVDNQTNDGCFASDVCLSECQCAPGYKRDDSGTCIPQDQCPDTCGENEALNLCTSFCRSDACPTYLDDSESDDVCITLCGPPRCECIENFKRDSNGKCIPIQDCPGICPENEEFSTCTQDICWAQLCSQANQAVPCAGIDDDDACNQGCVCVPGTLRDDNGDCIPQEQCPGYGQCGNYETFNTCPSVCTTDACPVNLSETEDIEPCTKNCGTSKCECIENYRRDDYGNCIPIEDCPQLCSENEEYNGCPQTLCRAQNCSQSGQPISCSDVEEALCEGGCVCVEGTLRDENGICVPEDQCSKLYFPTSIDQQQEQCFGPNEELSCVSDCPPERTCKNRDIQFSCLVTNKRCQIKCVCKPGFYRNALGTCISGDECDLCPGEHEFFACDSACDNVCTELATQNRTNCPIINIMCNRKCYCEDGYARDNYNNCVPVDQCPNKGN